MNRSSLAPASSSSSKRAPSTSIATGAREKDTTEWRILPSSPRYANASWSRPTSTGSSSPRVARTQPRTSNMSRKSAA
jgi:hypothetical protein